MKGSKNNQFIKTQNKVGKAVWLIAGFYIAIFFGLPLLKITGMLNISWAFATSPIWVSAILWVVVFVAALFYYGFRK